MESYVKIGHKKGLLHWDMLDEQGSLCAGQLLGIRMLCGRWEYGWLGMHDI